MGKRLLSFDLLRGFFLFVIVVDHVELYPSLFDMFTGRGRLWVSAAEGFFFISGLLVSYIYRKNLHKGMAWIIKKMWRRAGELYLVNVIFTIGFTYWAIASGHTAIKDGLNGFQSFGQLLLNTLTLEYSFGWADFLPHYVLFMLAAPLAFWLLSRRAWPAVLLASIALWAHRGESFAAAWQVLFMGGMVVGYHWHELQSWWRNIRVGTRLRIEKVILVAAILTFSISYASVYLLSELNAHWSVLPTWVTNFTSVWNSWNATAWPFFEKWTLEPGRVIVFGLWFCVLYRMVGRNYAAIQKVTAGLFSMLGRHSLFVYGAHAVLIFILHLFITSSVNLFVNFIATTAVLAVILALTAAREYFRLSTKEKYLLISQLKFSIDEVQ